MSKSAIENSNKSVDITTARIFGITHPPKIACENSKLCTVSNGGTGVYKLAGTEDFRTVIETCH